MSSFDLLDAVLPTEGRYCVIGIGKYPDQHFVDTREQVTELSEQFVSHKVDAYFGCAKYGPLNNRTHENATYFRALWMDIDCGPTKAEPDDKGVIRGYIDQQAGLVAFKKFCQDVCLPRPIIVSSGYGIHAYWLIEETITRAEWVPLAKRLRELCVEKSLIVDPSVFEPSRVLRIPGTFNFKNHTSVEVTVINENTDAIPYTAWKELLGAGAPPLIETEKPDFIPRTISPLMEAMMQNRIKRFKTIMIKSAKGEGCNQLLYCYENQADLDYNLWRSALSIAAFCVDKDAAVLKMSANHPGYDEYKTSEKVADLIRTGGPHHCATFEKLNPEGCANCKHKGKFKSPISLGAEIAEADDGDCEVEVEVNGTIRTLEIPEFPHPFFRGKNGGIYRKPDDAEDEAKLVYEHDLYVVKRMHDPDIGECALFRLHLPQDGMREFTIPLTLTSVKDELRKALARHGVALYAYQLDLLLVYVTTSIKNLQITRKSEIMRTQFGWVEENSKFILGEREITKDGVFYSPPSHVTKDIAAKIATKGTFEKWKEVFNMYAKPGLEPHAFAAITAFGSPLLKFTGMSGAIINVIHATSGSGKSTALFMCNSVMGHPKGLGSIWKDTFNAKMHRLGVMNNLANTIDEITNTSPMEFSDLAYSISQGRGKDRMKQSTNEQRANLTSWQGITLASSNASFYQKLGAAKNSPDGESMRLLEYAIKPTTVISVAEGKAMFDHQLMENYGHAGEVYLTWLVNNLEEAIELVKKVQARIDKQVQITSRERFWSALCACNIAGGLIARSLGLHDYDMAKIYEWMCTMLGDVREDIKPPTDTPLTVIGEYLNHHINNAVVVNGELDARSNLQAAPLLEPRGELLIRYEPDTKSLWIAAKQFKDFCVGNQINYKDVIKELTTIGVFKEAMNKRMSKGMKLVTPAIRALHLNTTNASALHLDTFLSDENRDSQLPD